MCLKFQTAILKIHYSKFHSIDKVCLWIVRMKNLTMDKLYSIHTCDTDSSISKKESFMTVINCMKEDTPKHEVE